MLQPCELQNVLPLSGTLAALLFKKGAGIGHYFGQSPLIVTSSNTGKR